MLGSIYAPQVVVVVVPGFPKQEKQQIRGHSKGDRFSNLGEGL